MCTIYGAGSYRYRHVFLHRYNISTNITVAIGALLSVPASDIPPCMIVYPGTWVKQTEVWIRQHYFTHFYIVISSSRVKVAMKTVYGSMLSVEWYQCVGKYMSSPGCTVHSMGMRLWGSCLYSEFSHCPWVRSGLKLGFSLNL